MGSTGDPPVPVGDSPAGRSMPALHRSGLFVANGPDPGKSPVGAASSASMPLLRSFDCCRSLPINIPPRRGWERRAARRVFAEKAVWLSPARECFRGCSVVAARSASFVAPRHPAFSPKTAPLVVSKQALSLAENEEIGVVLPGVDLPENAADAGLV